MNTHCSRSRHDGAFLGGVPQSGGSKVPRVTSVRKQGSGAGCAGAGSRTYTINHYSSGASQGFVSSTVTPLETTTFSVLDGDGRPKTIALSGARTLNKTYDANGNLLTLQEPKGAGYTHTLKSNTLNLLGSYQPPAIGYSNTDYDYDLDGLLLDVRQPTQQVATYARDAAGRIYQTTYNHPTSGTVVVSTHFDATTGMPCTSSSGACTATNGPLTTVATTDTYDGKMMTAETTNLATPAAFYHTVNWAYDNAFRVSEIYIDGHNWTDAVINYDNDSLVATVGATPAVTVNGQSYNVFRGAGAGGLVKCTSVGGICEKYTYNAFGELIEQNTILATCDSTCAQTGTILLDLQYTRTTDPAGRITSKYENVPATGSCTTTYQYDTTYPAWLHTASRTRTGSTTCTGPSLTQTYDADGNITAGLSAGSYDAQDQLTYDGYWTYSYDATGNLAWQHDPFSNYYYTKYDTVGNLRRYQPPFNPIDYIVDANNRRVARIRNGTFKEGYIYDHNRIIGHVNNLGALDAAYVYVTKPNVPDLIVTSSETYRVVSDQIGSVRRIIPVSTHISVLDMAFDAFGVAQPWLNGASTFAPTGIYIFGFAGGLWDPDASLYHFGARDYNPYKGIWITKDPIRFNGGLNLYAYCDNDPVNCIDPTGRYAWWIAPTVVLATSGGEIGLALGVGAFLAINVGIYHHNHPYEPEINSCPVEATDFPAEAAKKEKTCSCKCYKPNVGPGAIGQRTPTDCADECRDTGYTGYQCGGPVTWFD